MPSEAMNGELVYLEQIRQEYKRISDPLEDIKETCVQTQQVRTVKHLYMFIHCFTIYFWISGVRYCS